MNELLVKKCDLCHNESDTERDILYFGEWLQKGNITVHHFCLLLSKNLTPNGQKRSGIKGFLMNDIRQEIKRASKCQCCYCNEYYATIFCATCGDALHLNCGRQMRCLFQFGYGFNTYCNECLPIHKYAKKLNLNSEMSDYICYICYEALGPYSAVEWIWAECCGNGYVHRICMQKYAYTAGRNLKCIWCNNKNFRENIKLQGIYVPDTKPQCEESYGEEFQLQLQCEAKNCLCPFGRKYNKHFWKLISCEYCGGYNIHNPKCMTNAQYSKKKIKEYICDICAGATNLNSKSENKKLEEICIQSINNREEEKINENEIEINSLNMQNKLIAQESIHPLNSSNSLNLDESLPDINLNSGILSMYEFDSNMNCLGTCYVYTDNIHENKTEKFPIHVPESNIIGRTDDKGIFKEINKILEEYQS
ncbi:PHD finger protein 7-like [Teleopsis dalmanni]|uniref:PHD finger protein 7-like n=1 Tax=Teleopsis dalmanni TaxID=139649 RepID=UPI0018CDDAAF|nr:PHD finger protein 7-like [Teleopsis dalmanni]